MIEIVMKYQGRSSPNNAWLSSMMTLECPIISKRAMNLEFSDFDISVGGTCSVMFVECWEILQPWPSTGNAAKWSRRHGWELSVESSGAIKSPNPTPTKMREASRVLIVTRTLSCFLPHLSSAHSSQKSSSLQWLTLIANAIQQPRTMLRIAARNPLKDAAPLNRTIQILIPMSGLAGRVVLVLHLHLTTMKTKTHKMIR